MKISYRYLFVFLSLGGVFPLHAQNINYQRDYQKAIQTAMYPPANTVDSNLIALTPENKNLIRKTINGEEYILVVSWKGTNFYGDSGAYNTGSNPNYMIWVTAAPELQQRMKKEKTTDKPLRLKQMLGLPPVNTYNWFIEFWVKPSDLFRPCPDKEVTDKKCNLCFNHQDSLDANYINWINATRISRYYTCGLYNQYPWTQLGYTYDWNPANKSHIGLCEFVIDLNKTIYVNKVYTTAEYLK